MNDLLEAQEQSISYQWKRGQNTTSIVLTISFFLKAKKAAFWLWKGSQLPIKGFRNLARACRGAARKAKAKN